MEEVINDLMGYEGLKIIQRPDMFNFSLDSLLLAYYAPLNSKTKKIMDFCSGNGPVPLYLSLRTKAKIEAVEIQTEVYDLLTRSVKLNGLEDQIISYNRSLVDIYKELSTNTYDLVTCNPPYFKITSDKSHINESVYKVIARHELTINIEEIIIEAKRLLKTKGYFVMVHRPDRLIEISELLRRHKIEPKEIYFVHPNNKKDANHMVMICQKDGQTQVKIHQPIIVYNEDGTYTEKIKAIFNYKTMLK